MRNIAALFIICAFTFIPVKALSQNISSKAFGNGLLDDARNVVRINDATVQKADLDRIIGEKFASHEFLMETLWKYWSSIDEVRRQKIQDLFPKTLTKNIMKRLKKAGSKDIDSFRLIRIENALNGKLARYKGRVNDQSVELDILIMNSNGTSKIANVIIENADMRQNYEGQFSRIIDKYGVDELIRRLEDKAGK